MALPYITIGIVVRNCEKKVKDVIDSILLQDYDHQKMEIIFVDDGSIDRTFEYANQLLSNSDISIKILKDRWKGIASSRNKVIKNAMGKYIVWVDGDMLLPKHYVYSQVEFMELNPKVAVAKAHYCELKKFNFPAVMEYYSRISTIRSELLVGTGGSIYRTQVIKEIGGFDENIRGAGEDLDAVFRIKAKGWFICKNNKAMFFENFRETWSDLWKEYFWWGYGAHYVKHKYKNAVTIAYRLPMFSLIIGILKFIKLFKMHHIICVFLPFYLILKDMAWIFGFIESHLDGYGHTLNNTLL
ncbi:MAG: glycosyltransferase [Candidatus Bathyarchaeia archaeon]